jgi:nicotinate-nucleotide adenylyltransferase
MRSSPQASGLRPQGESESETGSESESGFVALFGGSFNPPHLAHVLALSVILARFEVGRILVIPTFQHPFAKSLVPYEDRVTMCELAMGWLPKVEVSRVEEELGGESRTLRTIEHLKAKSPETPLRLVCGADIIVESAKWFGFDRIRELAPPIVLGRVGVEFEGAPPPILPELSSTEIRTLLGEGKHAELEPLMPKKVLDYIKERGLYSASA